MPHAARSFFLPLGLALLTGSAAQAQDVYFSQAYANRQADNPAWAGIVDDYSATLGYRNQFPQLAGAFETVQLAADWRLPKPGLHHALGLLVSQDRAGGVGYTRFSAAAQYAYHTRLTRTLALSGGAQVGYGRQRVGYDNFTFGDQYSADGSYTGATAESLAGFPPINYFTVGVGGVLYAEEFWVSLSGQHLNRPDLGFRQQAGLPLRISVTGGYKLFLQKPVGAGKGEQREISLTPTLSYSRQGGSQRSEAGAYFLADPVTVGAIYRNLASPDLGTQHVVALVAGVAFGDLRVGYAYDVGVSPLASALGGAHEITLTLRAFDKLESAFRRLKRRNYPKAPCPDF
ncbi:PorP/SprF family type IX secretion system membrane protein [Hymenobacter sp. BRD128]|uniref:PorP/SprF family type IX secretion system membrane protein n=1 Tax=Hymenobacter sp. BRD128 TaxID=2675878 RepID=UPI00156483C5|nr:PorP/SprF family type IX secretion system membrane protein [Hymenobacter sp. BRD128]QKG58269.1 PorP/SprF family type IX secretion system membrane protein [Hymenobacter sp. BRD128]